MEREERASGLVWTPATEARLVRQLRAGDAEAGRQLVREYYPGVYRYLLYLTRRPETAEDLTQETFLQAWSHLDSFQGRAPLRLWLHRIAHREFLQALRRQRPLTSLEEVAEPAAPRAAEWTEAVELRDAIRKLPFEEGEIVVLHYLQGYNCQEIAQIVRAPVTTVKYRLMTARAHLQRELGEGDMAYLNEQTAPMRQWAWLPLEALAGLEARLTWKGEYPMSDNTHAGMSRRRLLEAAGSAAAVAAASLTGPAGAAPPPNEADVVDDRLTRKITLAAKATALSDLCEKLRADTGVHIAAGPSVADEKVTLFCKDTPLREVMRQLSRPFGYTWLRSKGVSGIGYRVSEPTKAASSLTLPDPKPETRYPIPDFRYELAQDLRSQLLEEELRNRDRNAALLALEKELERYRPYLDLTPDEIVERAKTASGEEKKLLENIGGGGYRSDLGWGPIQMYFRLTSDQMAAWRAGEYLRFNQDPQSGELPLPPDIARGILQGWRQERIIRRASGLSLTSGDDPDGVPIHTIPEARATLTLTLRQTELGQYGLGGSPGFKAPNIGRGDRRESYAVGMSPAVLNPDNALVNAKLARDPALKGRVTVAVDERRETKDDSPERTTPAETGTGATVSRLSSLVSRLTSADVLEALHHATGMPIVSDYYTRLYEPGAVTVHDQPLFEALNHLADAMRQRWHKEERWLQFRSTSFYDDRLKEVPNRLLSRWQAARREHGTLTLDDLVEIAALPDAPLKAGDMAEGAKEIWGLAEWDLARNHMVLPNLRYLAQFTPEQRRRAESATGLPFTQMTLTQQQGFLTRALPAQSEGLQSLDELAGATLRVDYTQPGWYEWRPSGTWWLQWIVPYAPGPKGKRALRLPVRGQTREEALDALRRVDPETRAAVLAAALRIDPRLEKKLPTDEEQIVPTKLDLATVYIPDDANRHGITEIKIDSWSDAMTW